MLNTLAAERKFLSLSLSLLAFATLMFGNSAMATPAIKNVSGNHAGIGTPAAGSVHGWDFVSSTDITVTELGLWDGNDDGMSISHDIGIFDSLGTLLASGTISKGTGDTLIDHFRYVDITDVLVTTGASYTIAYYSEAPTNDSLITTATTLLLAPEIAISNGRWGYAPGLSVPTNTADDDRFGPNFMFEVSAVPEPETYAMLLAGLGLLGFMASRRKETAV